jgi:hypothetical protein
MHQCRGGVLKVDFGHGQPMIQQVRIQFAESAGYVGVHDQ